MKLLAVLIAVLMLIGAAAATAPAFITQTTPSAISGANASVAQTPAITWTALTTGNGLAYNVSMEGMQVVLINATTGGTRITVKKGVGQQSVLGDLKYNVTHVATTNDRIVALLLPTSRFEQENGTILVETNATAKMAVINLHSLFY